MSIDINTGWGRRSTSAEDSPELARAGVAENGAFPAGENSRHPPTRFAQSSMTNGENPTMNAVKASGLHPTKPAPLVDTGRIELRRGDDAMLACRQAGDDGVRMSVGAFPTHVGG